MSDRPIIPSATRRGPPTHAAIAAAHSTLVAENGPGCCFACGAYAGRGLERAHIVAKAHGGSYDPSNFWLLCHPCHREQPDGAPPAAQEMWRASRASHTDRLSEYLRKPMAAFMARVGTVANDAEAEVGVAAFEEALRVSRVAATRAENVRETVIWTAMDASAQAILDLRARMAT